MIRKAILASILSLWLQNASIAIAATPEDPHLESVKEIFEWVNAASDGFVTKKQDVRRMEEHNLDTPLIIYATEDIKKGELLVQTPWSHILHSKTLEKDDQDGWFCGTAHTLGREMKKGRDSFYAPYAVYINDEPDNQLPSQYSDKAKELLWSVIGWDPDEVNRSPVFDRKDASSQRIMPNGIADRMDLFWYGTCKADKSDKIMAKAASMVMQRADDHILIPAYDAFNHRNNDKHNGYEYMNARTKTTQDKYHQTFALRDIKKGEQIFISYNMCAQCGGRADYGFGTAEMFREYGFVEWFPQRWYYPGFGDFDPEENDMELNQFDLYQNEDSKDLTIVWSHLTKDEEKLGRFKVFLAREIRRLNRLKNIEWAHMGNWTEQEWKDSKITSYEWNNVNQFVDANIVAMSIALEDLSKTDSMEDENDEKSPLTVIPKHLEHLLKKGNHYASLDESELDDLAYFKITCDDSDSYNFAGYLDTEEAFFTDRNQLLGYFESYYFNQDGKVDVCYDIDNQVQMCSSYRPYHHEYMTHMAARYVKDVKRVAIVGKGDSLLLHEVMKYPDLEKVINLELDQTVTRKSFKHYRADPYYHDPRVDWWYGDVAKSLQILPESYYGSFDLVLVDLNERVLAKELSPGGEDVLSALTKLVSPETGVIVKNELFFNKIAKHFNYATEFYYESAMVCSETLALGSNGIDFFHAPIYNHGIKSMKNLLYKHPVNKQERHAMVHDFSSKDTSASCEEKNDDEATEKDYSSLGVMEIFTLEEIKGSILNWGMFMKVFIESLGFTIIENDVFPIQEDGLAVFVMEEGYLVSRTFKGKEAAGGFSPIEIRDGADLKGFAIGLEVYLWSQTERIGEFKNIFQKGFKADVVSSHKIVVGGMFGTKNWKSDSMKIGPPLESKTSDCKEKDPAEPVSSFKDMIAIGDIVTREVVGLTGAKKIYATVICGHEEEVCQSLDSLSKHNNVVEVVPIYDCTLGVEIDEPKLYACERSILERLRKNTRSDLLVMDELASKTLHRVVNSILDPSANRKEILRANSVVTTWSTNDEDETWRMEFLDRFRKQIHHDPVKFAEFWVESEKGSDVFRLGVVATKDRKSVGRFDEFEDAVRKNLPKGWTFSLRNIHGGLYNWVKHHNPKEFSESDYDKTAANHHFDNQKPLALQTVLQYEGSDAMKALTAKGTGPDCNFMEKLIYGAAITEGEVDSSDKYELKRVSTGDGCVVVLLAEKFNVVSVWDGKDYLNINLVGPSEGLDAFMYDQKIRQLSPFEPVATDVQPRGMGRVVNIPADLKKVDRFKLAESQMSGGHVEADHEDEEEDDEDEEADDDAYVRYDGEHDEL